MDTSKRSNIILVGFMGTGKSTVGRRLARRLGRPFRDTDRWIESQAGMSVSEIFAREGEAAFRDLESRAAVAMAAEGDLVVGAGGGLLQRPENLRVLRQSGVLVCLDARPEVILERTSRRDDRPLLKGQGDPMATIRRLLAEREAMYSQADWRVDTSDVSHDEVVERICERLPFLFREAATRS